MQAGNFKGALPCWLPPSDADFHLAVNDIRDHVVILAYEDVLADGDPSPERIPEKQVPEVDSYRCIGCFTCTYIARGVFKVGFDCRAHVVDPEASPAQNILDAVDICPMGAIRLRDRETGAAPAHDRDFNLAA